MARLGGFEPPTAWFVARYSIQLSYSRVQGRPGKPGEKSLKMARLGGFEPPTAWFVARYSIQLSYSRTFQYSSAPSNSAFVLCASCHKDRHNPQNTGRFRNVLAFCLLITTFIKRMC